MRGPAFERAFAWVFQLAEAANHTASEHEDLERMAEMLASKFPPDVFCEASLRATLGPGNAWPTINQAIERLRERKHRQCLTPTAGGARLDGPAQLTDVEWLMAKYYLTREAEGFGSTRMHASTPFPDDPQRARRHLLSSIKSYCFPAWDWLTGPDGPASDLRGRT